MNTTTISSDWHGANQRYMSAALNALRATIEQRAGRETDVVAAEHACAAARSLMDAPPALERLCTIFGLSAFERDLLLLQAGVELDASFAALCATLWNAAPVPTFGLALGTLPGAHWSALPPDAPLRRWRLIELAEGASVATSPLRIDERVLYYLVGVTTLDRRLQSIVEPLDASYPTSPSHTALVERLAAVWRSSHEPPWPIVQLIGPDRGAKEAIVAAACAVLGVRPYVACAANLPPAADEQDLLARLVEREAALSGLTLLIDDDHRTDTHIVASFVERVQSLIAVASTEPLLLARRGTTRLDVARPTVTEQRELWRVAIGPHAERLNGQIDLLATQFSLDASAIQTAIAGLGSDLFTTDTASMHLWDACRQASRTQMNDLAQPIDAIATWDDLVLPEQQMYTMHEIAVHVRQRARVYEQWGFARKGVRGLGISALFAGASGTGKTMAAEVLANELRLDLYRIDLSAVVSKYIGETEKNLRRIFDAAESGGAILLFDEADALFGKRSEVKDSHDRYANIEVSYLLQRMEAYRGLAILTTNLKQALDTAFLRRIRFVVQFPFPDLTQRAEIWRRVFPTDTPTEGLDPDRLARLNVAGGNIRNIALHAAFLAADGDEPVRMEHLLRAAHGEYAKLEKPFTDAEMRSWKSDTQG